MRFGLRADGRLSVGAMAMLLALWGWCAAAGAQVPHEVVGNPGQGYPAKQLGVAVALDGDTLVAGAPLSDSGTRYATGLACVYRRGAAGTWHLETELSASDAAWSDVFGCAVAVAGDTIVVGAKNRSDTGSQSGAAYVFVRTADGWAQEAKLAASDAAPEDQFGTSVAVRGDRVLVGAPGADTGASAAGAVYVFARSDGQWPQEAKLPAPEPAVNGSFGASVALDGNEAFVGATWFDNRQTGHPGAVYAFARSDGGWAQEAKIEPDDRLTSGDFGYSVAASSGTLVVGASWDSALSGRDYTGSAYVFVRSGGGWVQQAKLVAADLLGRSRFGSSVAIDGDTAVVGTYHYMQSAYVFRRSGTVWNQIQRLTPPADPGSDLFGFSVAVTSGSVAVGQYGGVGAVYVFEPAPGGWEAVGCLDAGETAADGRFGSAVVVEGDTMLVSRPGMASVEVLWRSEGGWAREASLSVPGLAKSSMLALDGGTAVVAVMGQPGSVYVFARTDDAWEHQATLAPSPTAGSENFGASVAVAGDTVAVGTSVPGWSGQNGAVYIFARTAGVWQQQAKLLPNDATTGLAFGSSVLLTSDTLFAGAPGGGPTQTVHSGAVYIFARAGAVWTQRGKVLPNDTPPSGQFGNALARCGARLLVGAPDMPFGSQGGGSAYIFADAGSYAWTQEAKLRPSDPAWANVFGIAVALGNDWALVGAPLVPTDAVAAPGRAYLFQRVGQAWVQRARVTSDLPANNDTFGGAVAIWRQTALVGAPLDPGPERAAGAVYAFDAAHTVVFRTDGTPGATLTGSSRQTVVTGTDTEPVTANSPAGHYLQKWTRDGVDYLTANPLKVANVTADTTLTAVFAAAAETLQVTIYPAEAIAAGAQWRRAGTTAWFDSGATETGLTPGPATVEFKPVTGWFSPQDVDLTITAGVPATAQGIYTAYATGATADYKVTYAGCWAERLSDTQLRFTSFATTATVKVERLEKRPANTDDVPGRRFYLLGVAALDHVAAQGDLAAFYTDAPVARLAVAGAVGSITSKNAPIADISVSGASKSIRLAATPGDTNPAAAATRIVTGGEAERPLNVALTGIVLESLKTRQTVRSLSVVSKVYRDPARKTAGVALSGLGRILPGAVADTSGTSYTLTAAAFGSVTAKGAGIRPDMLTSTGPVGSITGKSLRLAGTSNVSIIGWDDAPARLLMRADGFGTLAADGGVHGRFWAGFDSAGPTYTGAVAKVAAKKGAGTLSGELRVAPGTRVKFVPDQGAMVVLTGN